MIDYTAPRRALEMYVDANFNMVPVLFENIKPNRDLDGGYIDFTDIGTTTENLGMGEDVYSVRGQIIIRIFTPLGSGTQKGRQIATALDTLLTGQDLSGLKLEVPLFESFGEQPGVDWFQQNLTFNYQYFYGQVEGDC